MDDVRVPIPAGSTRFMDHLAVHATVAPSTQRTALNALMYLYTNYFGRDPQALNFSYAKTTRRLPTVPTHKVPTYTPLRNCWGTTTSPPPRFTPTCSTAGPWV